MNNAINRREFIKYSLASGAMVYIPISQASFWSWGTLLRLHPSRFFAGLIFDVAKAIFVRVAAKEVVSYLYTNNLFPSYYAPQYLNAPPVDEPTFRHAGYKTSIISLDLATYATDSKRMIKLELDRKQQIEKFVNIRQYLVDEKIKIKLADKNVSYLVSKEMEPDDFFSLDYMLLESKEVEHYKNLNQLSKSKVFGQINA